MLSSVPAPDDQCPRVLDQIDDTWEWLGDKLVKLPARRPVVQFPPGSLHRIAPVRDVIWTLSESSPVFLRLLHHFCPDMGGDLAGLRRGSVLTEGAKQTASMHPSASISSLLFFVLSSAPLLLLQLLLSPS